MKILARPFLKAFLIFISFFLTFSLYGQTPLRSIDLKNQKPSWQAVIGGNAVSPCVETSYGIAVVSDGRLLSACTNNGNVIWQRAIKGRPSKYLSAFGDFIYLVTSNSHLNLVNPSGSTVWSAVCPFDIVDNPLPGKDGRVFVRGNKGLACYGLNGRRKWHHETKVLSSLPISQLTDGSVIVYLSQPSNGKTIGKRFSAFGEELEDITFSGIVTTAVNCTEGILISLTNGSIGLITVQDERADSKWVTVSGHSSGAFSITNSPERGHACCFFQNGSSTQAVIVNVSDGRIINQFNVGSISLSGFKGSKSTSSGFFISGSFSACEFYEDGTILWSAVLPSTKTWNQMCYTKANYLLFCKSDWSMDSYKMNYLPGEAFQANKINIEQLIEAKELDSVSKQFNLHPLTIEKMKSINEDFIAGDYEQKEKQYLSDIKTEAWTYISSLTSKSSYRNEISWYSAEPVFTQNLLYLMSQCGTGEFSSLYSKILKSEKETLLLSVAITYAGENGFDPDGEVLNSFEYLLTTVLKPKDSILLKGICDSSYKICSFMGRPAFNKQGKNLLSRLMYPQYDRETREYARKTLEKMLELEK